MKSKQLQIPPLVSFLSIIIISTLLNNNNGITFTSAAAALDDQQSTSTAHQHSLRIGNNIMDTSTTIIITDEEGVPTKELVVDNKQQTMRSLEIVRDDTSEDEMPVIVGWRRRTQGKLYCIEGLLL